MEKESLKQKIIRIRRKDKKKKREMKYQKDGR